MGGDDTGRPGETGTERLDRNWTSLLLLGLALTGRAMILACRVALPFGLRAHRGAE